MSDQLVGKKFGPYEILELLGSGATARVYRAHQLSEGRIVALKILRPEFGQIDSFFSRFQTEMRLVANTQHFHVVPIFDISQQEGQPYVAMRYLDGGTLLSWIGRMGQMPPEMTVPIIKQVASALDHIHDRGLLHRDVRPANILFDTNSEAYLTDFNVPALAAARMKVLASPLPAPAEYLAPELTLTENIPTPSVDVYSLGVTLFHMLTGSLPYQGASQDEIARKHREEPIPSVQRFNPMLTQDIEIVLLRALGKQPADRFQKALDLSMALAKSVGVDIETTNRLDVAQLEELAKDMRQARADETPVKFDLASMVAADADSSSPTPVVKLAAPAIPAPRRTEAPADKAVEKAGPSTRQLSMAEVERQAKARQRAIRRAQRAPAPWYAVIPVMILLLLMWFSVGLFAGARVRIQVNQVTLSVIHAVQTGEAATATQIGEATQVAAANATATQSVFDATATAEAAVVVPTDTPTPSPTPTVTPSPTPTGVGGSLGRIALVSNRDGDNDIFLLDLNTGEFVNLTDNDVEDDAPAFSPDGQWIAYESMDDTQQRQHIFAMQADGSERHELTTGIRTDEYPIWSPEGTILFLSEEGNRFYLRSVTLEGVEIEILQLPVRVRPIEFTADGLSLLAFGRTPPDSHDELMNLELATGNRLRLSNQVGLIAFGDLSPDGSKIVFTWTLNNRRQVWLADTTCEFANRCNAQRLTDDFFNYDTPRFSPDGTLILVTANRFNHRDLFILDLNGNTVLRVTESPFEEFSGVWAPVGISD